jgi:hypothetical protein
MSRIITKKRLVLGVVTSLMAAALALAYWTTTGEGTGSGDVKETNGTVTLKGSLENEIAPGQNSDVAVIAWNTGDTDLWVTSTTLSNIAVAEAGSGTCVDSDFSETHTDGKVTQGVVIPHGTTEATAVTLPTKHNIAFANDLDTSQDACKDGAISFDLDSD